MMVVTAMHPSKLLTVSLMGLCTILGACDSAPGDSYFPLQDGLSWSYSIVTENPLQRRVEHLRIESLGQRPFAGEQAYLRRTSSGTRYWLLDDARGTRRIATQSIADSAPQRDREVRWVLPKPLSLGTEWSATSRPYALERAVPFRERFYSDPSYTFEMRFRLASLDDTVEVPAGRFEHCLRLDASGDFEVHADPRIGPSLVPVEQHEWYAPGVGLVRIERRETLDTTQVVGGSVVMTLDRFER